MAINLTSLSLATNTVSPATTDGGLIDRSSAIATQMVPRIQIDATAQSSANNLASALQTAMLSSNYANSIMLRGLDIAEITPTNWNAKFPYRFLILQTNKTGSYSPYLDVTLPITPSELQIASPFASQLTISSRGALEEHGGLRVKNISFTASTGVDLSRGSFEKDTPPASDLKTIFAGTIQAKADTISAFSQLFPQSQAAQQPTSGVLSGYYQYHLIRAFLELYAKLKESPQGAGYRLGLEMGKDQVIYLVKPDAFITKKSGSSPLEYVYSFQGTAWGTVDSTQLKDNAATIGFLTNNVSDAQKLLNRIRNARNVIQNAKSIITAVETDIQTNILGPMNNILLALKEATGVQQTIADFPQQLQLAFQTEIVSAASVLLPTLPAQYQNQFSAAVAQSLPESSNNGSAQSTVVTAPAILNDVNLTDNLSISSISMNTAQQNAVQAALLTAASTTNGDVNTLIGNLQSLNTSLEPQALSQGADSPIWEILYSLNDTVGSMYSLISDNFFGNITNSQAAAGVSSIMNFYQGYALSNGINFTIPKSKFSIPFPFKTTLEWLAQRYLGDATRWIEIAATNNLQAPYIDEDGFIYSFVANGNSNQFNINTNTNLFVGQTIWIMSNTQPSSKRTIQSIQQINTSNYLITVNGSDNLGYFTTIDKAQMKAYLPNTVNSQKLIYIPSAIPSTLDSVPTKAITFLDETPEMLAMAKVDWLLDSQGDLAVSAYGYQNLAYGKQNLIQAAKMKMSVVVGQLLLHGEWGAGVSVGSSEADITLANIAGQIRATFAQDPRFSSVDQITISVTPGVIKINLTVTAAGISGIIPIDFEISQ